MFTIKNFAARRGQTAPGPTVDRPFLARGTSGGMPANSVRCAAHGARTCRGLRVPDQRRCEAMQQLLSRQRNGRPAKSCRRRAGQCLPGATSGEGFQSDVTGFFPGRGFLSPLQLSAQRQSRPGEWGVSMRTCVCLALGDSHILRSDAAQDRSPTRAGERPSESHRVSLSEAAVAGLKTRSPDH